MNLQTFLRKNWNPSRGGLSHWICAGMGGLLLVAMFFLSGCNSEGVTSREGNSRVKQSEGRARFSGEFPIKVVCTTGMVADIVRNLGGEQVDVVQLMGEGVDPHLYEASPGDVSLLNRADIIFYSGLHLEGKLGDFLVSLARRRPTFAVTERLQEEYPEKLLEIEEGYYDPHIWFDVSLWSEASDWVGEVLADFDPEHADEYRKNTQAYRDELKKLDAYCREQIARIPEKQRVLVTAHDAFHYFGQAYDIEVKAIQGVSTDSEAGVKKINELVDFLVERNIKAVFVETSVSNRNVQALIEGCGQRDHQVKIGGELFSDAMGPLDSETGTYVGMVRHNVDTIVQALR